MDRRFFTKSALGMFLGGVTGASVTKAQAAEKLNEGKDTCNYSSDIADEQIKVIQSNRFYKNQGKKEEGKCTTLLCFADIHLVVPHIRKIRDFYLTYKKYINDAIHLGDNVGAYYPDKFELWEEFPESLNVLGNHDVYTTRNKNVEYWKEPNFLPDIEKYNAYFKRYIKKWKVRQPKDAEEQGKCYWYKDYNKDVRLIGIDCMNLNETQYQWFVATLESAAKKNLKVLIATHIAPDCDKALECNFTSLDYPVPHKSGLWQIKRFALAVDSFIENGGTFVSWLCGHNHHDSMFYVAGVKHKQLAIIMECATDFSWWTDAVHVPQTATATCWELISVESMSNVIKIARFGNNYDHYMRRKDTFCYDFKNHKIIWAS